MASEGKEAVIKTLCSSRLVTACSGDVPVLAILDYLLGLDSGSALFSLICLESQAA